MMFFYSSKTNKLALHEAKKQIFNNRLNKPNSNEHQIPHTLMYTFIKTS